MSSENLIRSFIAIRLPEEVLNTLKLIQNSLRDRLPQARWTRPEGIHLTLKFLGEVEESVVKEIAGTLDSAIKNFKPFRLELQGVGAFPKLAMPRVLWVGLQPKEELIRLQKSVENAVRPFGFNPEKRQFRGHLTLARLKGERWSEGLRKYFLESKEISDGMQMSVEEVILYRSDLKPGGTVYTAIRSCALS
ncbi:RNA 2',3'-cyclic phosphodiesterase [candidate division LCP-89 bacterium B3_LCP]|uniref:RNA 2',3'-cyclic phosphodiesterase n=1 Tax=candidate division LCP-89 bacterium B3_LCP TaxID=2012998 RepID=A0A532URJ3_UNCL8|nr:MAG: RNA 2',3'-cyclic phosphodiesterase [candidate division LCP-89 bacterium B3_LCP]